MCGSTDICMCKGRLSVAPNGSGVEFRTIDRENPDSNPVQRC